MTRADREMSKAVESAIGVHRCRRNLSRRSMQSGLFEGSVAFVFNEKEIGQTAVLDSVSVRNRSFVRRNTSQHCNHYYVSSMR